MKYIIKGFIIYIIFYFFFTSVTFSNIIWDFETGLQSWTHTNGQSFPAGWDIRQSTYQSSLTPPDAGDSSMWIDSWAAGNLVRDTAKGPIIENSNFYKLKWGVGFAFLFSCSLDVIIRQWTEISEWENWTSLKLYINDFGPAWDSVNITSYTGDSLQIGFYYFGDIDWFASFDNVKLYSAINIIFPNGGENLIIGDSIEIIWDAYNISSFNLDYSTDSGNIWNDIVDNFNISFSYNWEIPNVLSDRCLIRIVDYSDSNVFVISDSLFSIGYQGIEEITFNHSQINFKVINRINSNPYFYLNSQTTFYLNIDIFDLSGRHLSNLCDEIVEGEYIFSFKNESSGVYIYKISIDNKIYFGKIILLR